MPRPAPPAVAAPAHLPALDGLRGVAVLLVMVCHFTPELPVRTHLANLMARYGELGWVGVDMFFVLSGFLITRILFASRSDPRYFANFYVRRVLRIFPLYYLSLFAVFVLLPAFTRAAPPEPAAEHQLWLWTYTANLLVARRREWLFLTPDADLNHFWSLAIEEQFYLFWPLVVARLTRPRLFALAALGLAASPLLRLALQQLFGAAPMTLYTLTPCRLDGLLAGAALAAAFDTPALWRRVRPLAAPALGLAALGLAAVVVVAGPSPISRVMAVPGYFFVSCLFAALLALVLAAPDGRLARALRGRALATVGKYSYGLYVLHRIGVVRWLVGTDPLTLGRLLLGRAARVGVAEPVGLAAYVVVCTLVSLPIAYVSYQVVERPFLKLKDAFRPAAVAPAKAPRSPARRRRVAK